MRRIWPIIILLQIAFKEITSTGTTSETNDDPPLTKSLGYSVRKRFTSNLEDARLSREYMELYQDMLRVSQAERVDGALENVLGNKRIENRKRDVTERHRKGRRPGSVRRARSQALRRRKLSSQSLRSHQRHSRHPRRSVLK